MIYSQETTELMKQYNARLKRISNAMGWFELHPDSTDPEQYQRYKKIHTEFDEIAEEQDKLRQIIETAIEREITTEECLDGFKI